MKNPFEALIKKFKDYSKLNESPQLFEPVDGSNELPAFEYEVEPPNSVLSFDTRIPITPEYKSNMDIAMGNNWERLSAQLAIVAKGIK